MCNQFSLISSQCVSARFCNLVNVNQAPIIPYTVNLVYPTALICQRTWSLLWTLDYTAIPITLTCSSCYSCYILHNITSSVFIDISSDFVLLIIPLSLLSYSFLSSLVDRGLFTAVWQSVYTPSIDYLPRCGSVRYSRSLGFLSQSWDFVGRTHRILTWQSGHRFVCTQNL